MDINENPCLIGVKRKMIRLREIGPDDKEMIRKWRNMPEVMKSGYNQHVVTKEEHDSWYQRVLYDSSCKYWIIVCDGEDVGLVSINDIENAHKRCKWAFYVASPNMRGKGIGSYAEYFVLKYVFEELKLNKLYGEVLSSNKYVINMHKGFGFTEEGLYLEHVILHDEPQDVIAVAMFRSKWLEIKPRVEERLRKKGILL